MAEHNTKQKKYTALLPFETTSFDNFIIYDNAPFVDYFRNRSEVNESCIIMHNENMIKYYRINVKEAVKIGGDYIASEDGSCSEDEAFYEDSSDADFFSTANNSDTDSSDDFFTNDSNY